jgi:hypothetical protein
MKFPWFRRKGIIYIPITIAGWLILAAFIAGAIYLFIDIDRGSHSASDTIRPFLFWLILVFAAYFNVAWLLTGWKKD